MGYIAKHGLEGWWSSTFTAEERALMESRYAPMGGSATLLTGNAGGENPTDADTAKFLTGMASWFRTTDLASIGVRVLDKARSYQVDPVTEHFTLMAYVEVRYKQRGVDSAAVEDTVRACRRAIDIAPDVIEGFKEQHRRKEDRAVELHAQMGMRVRREPFAGIPNTPIFKRLAAILRKQGLNREAAEVGALYDRVWLPHTIDYRRAQAEERKAKRKARG